MPSKEGLSFAKTEITINGKDTASIAGLLLTTECVIVDKPEPKEEHDHAHPGMGGMGGMY